MKKVISILSVMVLLVCSLAAFGLSAAAVDSPSGEVQFTINHNSYNSGKLETKKCPVKQGDAYEFIAAESDYDFTGWKITKADGSVAVEGVDYTIVAGGLDQKTLKLKPLKDGLTVEEKYNVQGSEGYGEKAIIVGKINKSNESPKTGNQPLAMVTVVAAGAFSAMVLAKKRLAK